MMFPTAEVIKLQENYRSRAPICEVANAVITHNEARYDKQLVPTRGPGDAVQLAECDDLAHEATFVCETIRALLKNEQIPGSEIAVLYRSSRQARLIEEGLQDHNIDYRVLGGQAFYDKKDVKDVLAYLKVLVTPHDDIALRRALDVPDGCHHLELEETRGLDLLARVALGHLVLHLASPLVG
ncbi:MAG: 3'-5' exonuclease, partial [Nannocystaceae bacterium]